MKFADIGKQLRAFRLESGMRAEEIAARLGVSRAALYRYEKGEVIKLETIRRLAELLKVSPVALLGISIEYYARPLAYAERLRNLEESADQLVQIGGAVCEPGNSDAMEGALAEIWSELAERSGDRTLARSALDQQLQTLTERRRALALRRPAMIVVLSEPAIRRFLAEGVGGDLALPDRLRARCQVAAAAEVSALAALIEESPLGLQVGLAQGLVPQSPFRILRQRDRAHVVIAPMPIELPPWTSSGVAAVTSAEDAVAAHQRVAEAIWREALKGPAVAVRLRELVRAAEEQR
ncbi:MAG: helix-turn-helix transcriptional regulator [Rhodovarius sp.]|nr:helix-turn-helix transcriptional regulator [Rhodovarius sp.]